MASRAVWTETGRSKGWDVAVKIFGPRFDAVHRRLRAVETAGRNRSLPRPSAGLASGNRLDPAAEVVLFRTRGDLVTSNPPLPRRWNAVPDQQGLPGRGLRSGADPPERQSRQLGWRSSLWIPQRSSPDVVVQVVSVQEFRSRDPRREDPVVQTLAQESIRTKHAPRTVHAPANA